MFRARRQLAQYGAADSKLQPATTGATLVGMECMSIQHAATTLAQQATFIVQQASPQHVL